MTLQQANDVLTVAVAGPNKLLLNEVIEPITKNLKDVNSFLKAMHQKANPKAQ